MQNWPLKIQLLQKPRFIPLRYRLIFITSCTLLILFTILAFAVGIYQKKSLRQQIENRGITIVRSLAVTSANALINYNYIALEQMANDVAQDPDILYVIVHDKEGRVAGYSQRADLQGKILPDPVSQKAVAATSTSVLIQSASSIEDRLDGLDIAVPVYPENSDQRWGTVRTGISLMPMHAQITQTLWIIVIIGLAAWIAGILMSIWGARRMTRPLGTLVQTTIAAANGNFNRSFAVKTGDEVEVLADNFSTMIVKILEHRAHQEKQLVEIQRLQNYTEKLLTTMSDGLLSIGVDGNIATINPAARELLNIEPQNAVAGRAYETVIPKETVLFHMIQAVINKPKSGGYQEVRLEMDDRVKTILVGHSTLIDSSGHTNEVIFNLHDITDLKKLEARMRQKERLASLGTLAAGMAHEIRNPLSAIKTFVQLLPRKVDNAKFLEKFNRTVPRETERINQLVEELLELSRIPKYYFDPTDIAALLQDVLEIHMADIERCKIDPSLKFSDDLPQVVADANQLMKAFHNLVQNAIQAMPSGGHLQITTAYTTGDIVKEAEIQIGEVVVTVEDEGYGISSEKLKNIFDPFFTTKDTGTGLGLAITHKVITEHGGKIEVKSEEGKGTVFTVRLPVNQQVFDNNGLNESTANHYQVAE